MTDLDDVVNPEMLDLSPEQQERMRKQMDAIETAIEAARAASRETFWKEWLVTIPEYDKDGVKVSRWEITQEAAWIDQLRSAMNPQRSDRSIQAGTFTRLEVDGVLWMTDTPAEVFDLLEVDEAMGAASGGSMLIAGLGMGLVLNRAIVGHGMRWIDVVEREQRVIDAVGPHYKALADEHGITLNIHQADIHKWRSPVSGWDVGFFDIWPTISMDDLPEVKRLRRRFRDRLGWFGAWAEDEMRAQAHRIRTKTGFY